ncbi:tetratricopeptide repeat protein [Pontiella sulfatireligans]|uniref:Beta-barrel assembly-enhancing protease n=1 Tax=Pontiella sulfatireligans TaxID=2750658 RepID=A0A6C2USG0_9BACT|nr:tetratricopeptide repeat protein [Pontiella sulfatireligans]VGO23069.1 hypothetical protein SCARR_05168 [Pontiella sulfatireligans]
MTFIFRKYPSHPWLNEWTLEPRGCGAAFHEKNAGLFFQTLEIVGRVAPNLENPAWCLQIPVPQNSRTNMLFNGFCAYLERRKNIFAAEVIVPEAGVLWGRYAGIPDPVLATECETDTADGLQWLEHDDSPAMLAVRNGHFCLITKARIRDDAARLALSYLERDIEEELLKEYEHRSGAFSLFELMAHHDSLAAISAECMMRALRPAEGVIPMAWSQSPETEAPALNANELHPLALAWSHIDIHTAEELMLCTLKTQASSGAIPVHLSPHGAHSVLEAPKPLLAKTAEAVWRVRRNPDFLSAIIPLLRRHLQWLLHHFDPKRRGMHCWQNSSEIPTPEIYETDLSTVDLTVLLLTEIDALNHLREQSAPYADYPSYFPEEREALEHNLVDQFWNDEESAFTNAFVRGVATKVEGIPSLTPLLWKPLSNMYRSAIMERLKESGSLPGGVDVLSWHKSSLENQGFPLHQQLLVLDALKVADPHGTLVSDFSRITLQGFVEWHSLSLEEHKALRIAPTIAAFIINVQATHQYRYHAKGGITGYLFKLFRKMRTDRFDLFVVLVTLFTVFAVHTIYSLLHQPPPLNLLQAQMNSAYSSKDATETLKNCQNIIKHYPDEASMANLLAGNILLMQGDPATASALLTKVRATHPDSPGPMISLGLALQQQGRFKEAEENYAEFCYLFDEIFPELVSEINQYRYLAKERFRSPPKWTEIYRYQLMHEL